MMKNFKHVAMRCIIAMLLIGGCCRFVQAESYCDRELTEQASQDTDFLRNGQNAGFTSCRTYKVAVLKGETVRVKIDIAEKLVSCASGSCCVYVNGSLRSPTTSGHYALDLTSDSYVKIAAGASFPYDYATVWYCQVDYTIRATFPTRYTVTYRPGSGDVSGAETSEKCAGWAFVTLYGETYYKTGYRQTGWSESDGGAKKYALGGQVQALYDYTLYPYWQKVNTYTITYKADSYATGSATPGTKTQGVPFTLLAKAPFTRTDYVQRGWSRTSGGSCDYAFGASYAVDANLVLYPYWEKSAPKMVFLPGEHGTGGQLTYTKSLDSKFLLRGPIYTRSGYRQIGWTTKEGTGVEYALFSEYADNQDATFYPVWERDPAASKLYMVVDISAGSSAKSYPVSYLPAVPAGGWTEEHKTTKIVLRRIASQTNSTANSSVVRGYTTIDKPYYAGIFPVTQRQYELVSGKRPESSFSSYAVGDTLPTYALSYRTLHSYYVTNKSSIYYGKYNYAAVDPNGFIGRLRTRTGIAKFDLPSGVQWTYAARSGEYNAFGISYDEPTRSFVTDSGNVGLCLETKTGDVDCAPVGSTGPNVWGLYDMLGNVQEWGNDYSGSANPSYGLHGGCAFMRREYCTTVRVEYGNPSTSFHGFRLFCETTEIAAPSGNQLAIYGDAGATVTGDATNGYLIRPSDGMTDVEVVFPNGIDPGKVIIEVGGGVERVTPHGASVKIVKGKYDITGYLDLPVADASGAIDLSKATVSEAVVKDVLDTTKSTNPAVITLTPSAPSIRTAPTKPGLTYTFSEGTTLGGLTQKSTKTGDGNAWTPTLSVKGGTSGFYKIGVTK